MITDKLENIKNYDNFPIEAINFIKELDSEIKLGKYVLSDKVYANVEAYTTKFLSDAKFEAHEKYIDIQILMKGNEYIYYTNKELLTQNVPYNTEKDIIFYNESVNDKYKKIKLDGKNFVVLYPDDAHAPQVCINKEENVLKIVVKIMI